MWPWWGGGVSGNPLLKLYTSQKVIEHLYNQCFELCLLDYLTPFFLDLCSVLICFLLLCLLILAVFPCLFVCTKQALSLPVLLVWICEVGVQWHNPERGSAAGQT